MSDAGVRSNRLTVLNQPDCQAGWRASAANDEASRRHFLQGAVTFLLGSMQLTVLGRASAAAGSSGKSDQPLYGFLVDSGKCIGSGKCLVACRIENDVPEGYHRTWLERYIHFKDGTIRVESVGEAGASSLAPVDAETVDRSYFVPKLCNHCEDPPCNQVCPVHAAFSSPEGVTLVDAQRCIGCAYCVQACPYGARFIHPDTGTADKCTWCYHRVQRDEPPACVEACPVGARLFGRLDDPQSAISQRLRQVPTHVLKESLGTHPKTRYLGLSQEVI